MTARPVLSLRGWALSAPQTLLGGLFGPKKAVPLLSLPACGAMKAKHQPGVGHTRAICTSSAGRCCAGYMGTYRVPTKQQGCPAGDSSHAECCDLQTPTLRVCHRDLEGAAGNSCNGHTCDHDLARSMRGSSGRASVLVCDHMAGRSSARTGGTDGLCRVSTRDDWQLQERLRPHPSPAALPVR